MVNPSGLMERTEMVFVPKLVGAVKEKDAVGVLFDAVFVATGTLFTSSWKEPMLTRDELVKAAAEKTLVVEPGATEPKRRGAPIRT